MKLLGQCLQSLAVALRCDSKTVTYHGTDAYGLCFVWNFDFDVKAMSAEARAVRFNEKLWKVGLYLATGSTQMEQCISALRIHAYAYGSGSFEFYTAPNS